MVCVGEYLCETHTRNQLATLQDYYHRVKLVWLFGLSLLFFCVQ